MCLTIPSQDFLPLMLDSRVNDKVQLTHTFYKSLYEYHQASRRMIHIIIKEINAAYI